MKKIALSSILFWFLFSVSGIIQAGTYIVGVENLDFLPFESSPHGEYSGYFKELLEKFGAASGNTFIFKPMPVKRLINDQFMNTIDFKIPDNKFWASVFKNLLKKGHKVVYSNPVTIFTEGILLLPANKGTAHPAVAKMTKVRGFTPFPFKRSIAEGSVNFRDAPSTGAVIK